jgi:flagellar assembly protein FliH
MSQTPAPSPFAFQTEFTPRGDIIGGPEQSYLSRQQAEALASAARRDAETASRRSLEASFTSSFERVSAHLSPIRPLLAQIADDLRRDAADLALVAARVIAGKALDAVGAQVAADAVAEAVLALKARPEIIVSAPPESLPAIEARLAETRGHAAQSLVFRPDPTAQPGDWRVEWAEGAMGFRREDIEAAVAAAIDARLQDPVEHQLDLFNAA